MLRLLREDGPVRSTHLDAGCVLRVLVRVLGDRQRAPPAGNGMNWLAYFWTCLSSGHRPVRYGVGNGAGPENILWGSLYCACCGALLEEPRS